MLNLTSQFLPPLTQGYRWEIEFLNRALTLSIIKWHGGERETIARDTVLLYEPEVPVDDIKGVVIDKARKMVTGWVPWSPERSADMENLIRSVMPPSDSDSEDVVKHIGGYL